VAVEAPGKCGVPFEPPGVGHLDEGNPEPGHGGVGLPEPFVAPKVGQPRIDTHAGPRRDQQRIGIPEDAGGLIQALVKLHFP